MRSIEKGVFIKNETSYRKNSQENWGYFSLNEDFINKNMENKNLIDKQDYVFDLFIEWCELNEGIRKEGASDILLKSMCHFMKVLKKHLSGQAIIATVFDMDIYDVLEQEKVDPMYAYAAKAAITTFGKEDIANIFIPLFLKYAKNKIAGEIPLPKEEDDYFDFLDRRNDRLKNRYDNNKEREYYKELQNKKSTSKIISYLKEYGIILGKNTKMDNDFMDYVASYCSHYSDDDLSILNINEHAENIEFLHAIFRGFKIKEDKQIGLFHEGKTESTFSRILKLLNTLSISDKEKSLAIFTFYFSSYGGITISWRTEKIYHTFMIHALKLYKDKDFVSDHNTNIERVVHDFMGNKRVFNCLLENYDHDSIILKNILKELKVCDLKKTVSEVIFSNTKGNQYFDYKEYCHQNDKDSVFDVMCWRHVSRYELKNIGILVSNGYNLHYSPTRWFQKKLRCPSILEGVVEKICSYDNKEQALEDFKILEMYYPDVLKDYSLYSESTENKYDGAFLAYTDKNAYRNIIYCICNDDILTYLQSKGIDYLTYRDSAGLPWYLSVIPAASLDKETFKRYIKQFNDTDFNFNLEIKSLDNIRMVSVVEWLEETIENLSSYDDDGYLLKIATNYSYVLDIIGKRVKA